MWRCVGDDGRSDASLLRFYRKHYRGPSVHFLQIRNSTQHVLVGGPVRAWSPATRTVAASRHRLHGRGPTERYDQAKDEEEHADEVHVGTTLC